jgi:putative transposase
MSRDTSLGQATVRQLCQALRISRQAFYQALQGPSPVVVARVERRGEWTPDRELLERIQAVAAAHPGWGSRKVWAFLRREGVVASRRRVWKRMQALGLLLAAPEHQGRAVRRGHVSVPESNRRWGTDLTTIYTRQDGVVAIVPVIDFGDRLLLAWRVTKSQESWPVLAPTEAALAQEFGAADRVPDGLEWRTDHGPQFTGGDAEELARRWRLEHTFAPVGRPTGNAVTERFILTLKTELLWTRDWESIAEIDDALRGWSSLYNNQRPHQALGWRTPAEQRALNLSQRPRARAA